MNSNSSTYVYLSRFISLITGPITVLNVSVSLDSTFQGYYYTFYSLLSLQMFAELGLGVVIQNFVGTEYSFLSFNKKGFLIGKISSLDRIKRILRMAFIYFASASILLFIIFMISGSIVFSDSIDRLPWFMPWLMLSIIVSLNILQTPIWALIEGIGHVKSLYRYRFLNLLLVTSILNLSLFMGFKLWSIPLAYFFGLCFALLYLSISYLKVLIQLFRTSTLRLFLNFDLNLFKEIFPFQIRVGMTWMANYATSYLFVPILFMKSDPVLAGKFGMSWTIFLAIGSISSSWYVSKIPYFAILVGQKKINEAKILLLRSLKITSISSLFLLILFFLFLNISNKFDFNLIVHLQNRLLDFKSLFFLGISLMISFSVSPFSGYFRAFKKEILFTYNILNTIVTITSFYFFLTYYSLGSFLVYYAIQNILGILVMTFIKFRFEERLNVQ